MRVRVRSEEADAYGRDAERLERDRDLVGVRGQGLGLGLGLGLGFECDGDRHERGAEVLGGDPDQLEVSDRTWRRNGAESTTAAGPHGRTAASYRGLSGLVARPKCAQRSQVPGESAPGGRGWQAAAPPRRHFEPATAPKMAL